MPRSPRPKWILRWEGACPGAWRRTPSSMRTISVGGWARPGVAWPWTAQLLHEEWEEGVNGGEERRIATARLGDAPRMASYLRPLALNEWPLLLRHVSQGMPAGKGMHAATRLAASRFALSFSLQRPPSPPPTPRRRPGLEGVCQGQGPHREAAKAGRQDRKVGSSMSSAVHREREDPGAQMRAFMSGWDV